MEYLPPSAAKTMAYYYPLLLRYAIMVTGHPGEAGKITRMVLKEQYRINGLVPSKMLRLVLKTDVLNRCFYFKQRQLFKRPPFTVPLTEHLKMGNLYDNHPLLN